MNRRARDSETDIVTPIIAWLAREASLDIEKLRQLEHDLRTRYGGRKRYVATHGSLNLDERNTLIQEAWLADMPSPAIARKFSISTRRVRQICAGLPRQSNLQV